MPEFDTSRAIRRRDFLALSAAGAALAGGIPLARAWAGEREEGSHSPEAAAVVDRLDKPRAEWRKLLPAERYAILFEEGTERPGSSPLNAEKREGTYVCAACYLPLFTSETKYESGTGWPSFYEPIAGRLGTKRDYKLILPRTEYHCIRCGGHQGHVFDDGPPPTGKRYCNNGLALDFVPSGAPLPELRR